MKLIAPPMKLLTIIISLISISAFGVTEVNIVTDYGAHGDAIQCYVSTVSNSVVVGFPSTLSASDIGKTVELFDVGQKRIGMDIYNGAITGWINVNVPENWVYSRQQGVITNIVGNDIYIDVWDAKVLADSNYVLQGNNSYGGALLSNTTSLTNVYTCQSSPSTNWLGKGITLYNGAGFYVFANPPAIRYQGLLGIITNVAGTNAYISGDIPQVTANSAYCYYGHNNATNFQAAVDAASGTNTIINIPAGNYLMIPPKLYTNNVPSPVLYIDAVEAFIMNKGGITFLGAGKTNTILTAMGAYKCHQGWWAYDYDPNHLIQNDVACRGMFFNTVAPITNDYPIIFSDITFDGGMALAKTGNQGTQPCNPIDGLGWDGTSAVASDRGSGYPPLFKGFYNCEMRHFMGEVIKGITGTAGNSDTVVSNCFFWDGNATAFNYNTSHTITGCTFSNMYQIEEFYLKYSNVRPSYFINNYATNITHNFVSLNGGTLTNQPYVISNNVLYGRFGGNAIASCPAANVTVASNTIVAVGDANIAAVVIGQNGVQAGSPDACNKNWDVYGNTFVNCTTILGFYEGSTITDNSHADGVRLYNNTVTMPDKDPTTTGLTLITAYALSTNVLVYSNTVIYARGASLGSSAYGGPMAYVSTNNNYWSPIILDGQLGPTNRLSYNGGSRYALKNSYSSGSTFNCLVASDSALFPKLTLGPIAIMVTNAAGNAADVPLYLNASMTDSVTIPYQGVQTFYWTGSAWSTNSSGDSPIPPFYPVFIPGHKYYRLKIH